MGMLGTETRKRGEWSGRHVGRWAGGLLLSGALIAVMSFLAIGTGAGAGASARHHKSYPHFDWYYESTPKGATYSLNGTTLLQVLETPPLPAGNYGVTGIMTGSIGSTTTLNDEVACYTNLLPNKTSTYDGHYAWGEALSMTLTVVDAFKNVPAGSRIGLFCYEQTPNTDGEVSTASLSVTNYPTMSVNGS
jgi:hypothetical protein